MPDGVAPLAIPLGVPLPGELATYVTPFDKGQPTFCADPISMAVAPLDGVGPAENVGGFIEDVYRVTDAIGVVPAPPAGLPKPFGGVGPIAGLGPASATEGCACDPVDWANAAPVAFLTPEVEAAIPLSAVDVA